MEFAPRGTETLLLFEDEKLLCTALTRIMEDQGYRVITAYDGDEGIEKYRKHKSEFALVITDIGLPKMTVVDMHEELKNINPDIKTILAGGFIEHDKISDIYKKGIKYIMKKPY
jgi:two-component system, cell cycle sensor histidine kinase and response regulator CckA